MKTMCLHIPVFCAEFKSKIYTELCASGSDCYNLQKRTDQIIYHHIANVKFYILVLSVEPLNHSTGGKATEDQAWQVKKSVDNKYVCKAQIFLQ